MSDLRKGISEERKKHQAEGLLPEWYTTDGYFMFKQKYLWQADSYKEQITRIAKTAAKHTNDPTGWEQKFFELFWNGYLSPSTPVLSNMGTDRGLPVSCSGQYIGDSIYEFYSNLLETSVLTKNGFGTSAYLGDIRPRGSKISNGGKASGVVPVFQEYVDAMKVVTQGTARRGAWAGYLPIDHGDFDELADFIKNNPDDANVGWCISNKFIENLDSGDSESIRRYQKAMKLKMLTGKGYFFFTDKVNAKVPETYKKLGLDVKSSNLCVVGDTIVEVKIDNEELKITIEALGCVLLTGKKVFAKSYNTQTEKDEWKQITDFALTKRKAKLVKVTDSDTGKFLICTPCHLIFTKNRGYVEAGKLNPDDVLIIN